MAADARAHGCFAEALHYGMNRRWRCDLDMIAASDLNNTAYSRGDKLRCSFCNS